MKVALVDYTEDHLYKIGKFAGICYDAKIDRDNCARRAVKCLNSGHLATLRFAYATFHVEDISRICSHQFVRSKHLDFLQESQRYVKQSDRGFAVPVGTTKEQEKIIGKVYNTSRLAYDDLLGTGMRKEDARFILPEASLTSLYVTGNLQAWRDFLKLRTDKAAQWEIREVAELIGHKLSMFSPELFKDYRRAE